MIVVRLDLPFLRSPNQALRRSRCEVRPSQYCSHLDLRSIGYPWFCLDEGRMLHVPTDVCYAIIDTVSALQHQDDCCLPGNDHYITHSKPVDGWRAVLISCALVSHTWYFRAKPRLEWHISLASGSQVRVFSARLRSKVETR